MTGNPTHRLFIMTHQDDGEAVVPVESMDQIHDLTAGRAVQVAGRFIGQKKFRILDERAGDGNPLLLPSGQFRGQVVDPVEEPHALKGLRGLFPPDGTGHVLKHQGKFDILDRGACRKEMEHLEDDADDGAPEEGKFTGVERTE